MKKLLLIFIFSGIQTALFAQNYIDLAKLDFASTPPTAFDTGAGSTTLNELNANLTLPVVINDDVAFLTGITYENVSAAFAPGRAVESFSGLILKLGANITHNEKWSGSYLLLPQISSDFKQISSKDLQMGVAVLLKRTKTERFNYKLGVYANSERFGPFLVPIFGFYYLSKNDKFEAKVLLPLAADLNYALSKKVKFGLNFKGQVKSYNVNTPVDTESDRYLTKSAKDLYTYLQYGMENGLHFQLAFGRTLGRHYRMYSDQVSFGMPLVYFGDDRTQLNTDFEDSWLLRLGAFYRLNLD